MTQQPTSSEVVLPAVQATQVGTERLGVTWDIRYGTVVQVNGVNSYTVKLDGDDDASIPTISLVEPILAAGARVTVLAVPPSGNYIIAAFGVSEVLLDAVETSVGATDVTAGAAEKNLGRLQLLNIPLKAGVLHSVYFQLITTRTTAADEFDVRVRQDTALTGTLLGSALAWGTVSTAGQYITGFIHWVQPTTVASGNLFLSVIRNSGAGTMTVFYSSFAGKARSTVILKRVGQGSKFRTVTV